MGRVSTTLLVLSALTLASRLFWRAGWSHAHSAAATKRSRGIIQHANDAIISTDGRQRILLANPAAATMFGTTVQAMQDAPLHHYIPRDQRQHGGNGGIQYFGDTGIRMRMKGRRTGDYAVTGLKAGGQHFPLEGSISSLAENGDRIYTIILRDITERKQVQEQLEQSYSQLRELSAALQTIREEERKHIARELHDDLGQLLATLRGDLALLQRHGGHNANARKLQAGMDELLMSAITSLRRIAGNLRPRALDEGGLYFALESLRHEFVERNNIDCTLDAYEEDLILDDAYSTVIFRIVQEALTNIARHAQAGKVALSLYRQDATLHVTIHDDGRGIAEKDMDKASSFGLIGMRERVWALHGDIAIVSDGGTRIMIRLPLPPASA